MGLLALVCASASARADRLYEAELAGRCPALCSDSTTLALVFGTKNCQYSGPARTAADSIATLIPETALCYVDLDTPEGSELGDQYRIKATPTLVVLEGGLELWRATAPAEPSEVLELMNAVLRGRRNWQMQRALLSQDELTSSELLALGRAAEARTDRPLAIESYQRLLGSAAATHSERMTAGRRLIQLDPMHFTHDAHIEAFPDDVSARAERLRNWMRECASPDVIFLEVQRVIDLHESERSGDNVPYSVSIYRLGYDLVESGYPEYSCVALSLLDRAADFAPKDGWVLQFRLTLSALCPTAGGASAAVERFASAYNVASFDQSTRQRFEVFVDGIRADAATAVALILSRAHASDTNKE